MLLTSLLACGGCAPREAGTVASQQLERQLAATTRASRPDTRTVESSAHAAVAKIRNDELEWMIARWDDGSYHRWSTPRIGRQGPARQLINGHLHVDVYRSGSRRLFSREELATPLLGALDDPNRYVVAHAILAGLFDEMSADYGGELTAQPDGTFAYMFDGLAVTLRPVGEAMEGTSYEGVAAFHGCTVTIDSGQLPAIRAQWQRRFGANQRTQ